MEGESAPKGRMPDLRLKTKGGGRGDAGAVIAWMCVSECVHVWWMSRNGEVGKWEGGRGAWWAREKGCIGAAQSRREGAKRTHIHETNKRNARASAGHCDAMAMQTRALPGPLSDFRAFEVVFALFHLDEMEYSG